MKKKIFKVAVAVTLVLTVVSSNVLAKNKNKDSDLKLYEDIEKDLNIVEVVDCDNLTLEKLVNRDGKIIIEKIIGEVVAENNGVKDGKILNCNSGNNYICYNSVEGAKVGNIILTYCIYNPDSNFLDDIILRYDYIIDNKEK